MTRAGISKAGLRRFQTALRSQPRAMTANVREHFRKSGAEWQGAMLDRFRGSPMRTRTGALKRSIRHRVKGASLRDIELRNVSTSRYARVHEHGTVGKGGKLPDIVPKRARALTIPLPDNLTPAGVPRYPSARALMRTGKTFLLKREGRRPVIMLDENGDGENLKALWVLMRRVSIPPRLGFFFTWSRLRSKRKARFLRGIRAALNGRRG